MAAQEHKFFSKLIRAVDWAGKLFSLLLVGAFMAWQFDLFPVFGRLVQNEIERQDFSEQIKLNTEFRRCWPIGQCEDITGLPIDDLQNQSIVILGERFEIVSNYIRLNCQNDRDKGDKFYDCTALYFQEGLPVQGGE